MDLLADFAAERTLDGFAESTIYGYVTVLRRIPFDLPGDASEVRRYLAERKQTVTVDTIVFELRALKCYSAWWAQDTGNDDPLAGVRFPKTNQPPPGIIVGSDDIQQVLEHLAHWGRDRWNVRDYALVRTFEYTGMRRSEVARMRIGDVDFDSQRIVVPVAKNGHGRTVPLNPATGKAIRRWITWRTRHGLPDLPELWVGDRGPLTSNGIGQALTRACERSGVSPVFTSHQFRRRLAAEWVKNGGADDALMLIAGWRSPAMPGRYRSALAQELAAEQYARIFPAPTRVVQAGRFRLRLNAS